MMVGSTKDVPPWTWITPAVIVPCLVLLTVLVGMMEELGGEQNKVGRN